MAMFFGHEKTLGGNMNKYIVAVSILFVAFPFGVASAATVGTNTGVIEKITAYDDVGGQGDVAIWFTTGVTECPNGVYLSPSAPGFNSMTSFALSAYMAGKSVRFQVYNDRLWPGTNPPLCEVDAISLQ
jgi:hypothetical protein